MLFKDLRYAFDDYKPPIGRLSVRLLDLQELIHIWSAKHWFQHLRGGAEGPDQRIDIHSLTIIVA
jgi:hypothetical protein